MKFLNERGQIYIPSGIGAGAALARTTHMGIGAHQDDLEILAIDGILRAYDDEAKWFTGVVVTDGAGSARTGPYETYSDDDMAATRADEQNSAAALGCYSAQIQLGYSSRTVKDAEEMVVNELRSLFEAASPGVLYTHNLWDKHDTHVAVVLRVIEALRGLDHAQRPEKLYGIEVWRDLDWVPDESKVVFDCSKRQDLQRELLEVFESQIAGGKRYDEAVMSRRRAHATYHDPHQVDQMKAATFGVDMTPLIEDDRIDVGEWAARLVERLKDDVSNRLNTC